ncbi:hypothetical protein SM124_19050 [Bacillus sp. 31A1R]|uniref:Uncharacterized protein n=1 Tax=Robertmurraya mangrovi TaxID=3098077 RepID=A0ABU5J3A3_9BACI|nr:hypothetical protein [Bacillus sp. 31A1R]MDZ5473821.1 hypothetical protein [Bacillus sp. 31A1R]
MRSLIANKLTYIWGEIEKYLEQEDKRNAKIISDELVKQRLFLLKNYPAYLYEYYLLAKATLEPSLLVEPLNIISFRSGSGIDYDAYYGALDEEHISSFSYTGIEPDLWPDQSGAPPNYLSWVWGEMNDLSQLSLNDSNVLIFPKSLKKLTYQETDALKRMIQVSKMEREIICIAFSAEEGMKPEFERNKFYSFVHTIMKWQKYQFLDKSTIERDSLYNYYKARDGRFDYPSRLIHFLRSNSVTKKWLPEVEGNKVYSEVIFLKKANLK